jgi:transposase
VVWRSVVGGLDSRSLVFVDEMGTHTSLAPLYGYSPRGQRAFFKIPRNRGTNTTLLSSMTTEGMGPSMAIEGFTTKEVFEVYVEYFLAPTLRTGQVVVMDNLSAHKGESVRKLIEDRGCELLYLPPYSPDLNPTAVCSVIEPLASSGHDPYFEDPPGKIVDAVEPSVAKTEALWVNVIVQAAIKLGCCPVAAREGGCRQGLFSQVHLPREGCSDTVPPRVHST